MTLIHRVARLFRADAHALLDRIEEPDLVLRQSVQEMQQEIDAERRRQRLMEQEASAVARRRAELSRELERLGEQLDVCFESGHQDLARGLIRRRLEAERLGQSLASEQEERSEGLARMRARLAENGARLEAMRQKAELLAPGDCESEPGGLRVADPIVRDDEVEVALLEEQRRRARS